MGIYNSYLYSEIVDEEQELTRLFKSKDEIWIPVSRLQIRTLLLGIREKLFESHHCLCL